MATAREVYHQTLPEVARVIRCKGCGRLMKLVFKNEKVAFWAHWSEYHKYHAECPTKLAYRTSYLSDLTGFIKDKFHGEQKEVK